MGGIMDDADRLDLMNERLADLSRQARKNRPNDGPEETGKCLSCGEPVAGRRWCDIGCRDDWEADQRRGEIRRI